MRRSASRPAMGDIAHRTVAREFGMRKRTEFLTRETRALEKTAAEERDQLYEYPTEYRPVARSVGRWLVLEFRQRTTAGQRLQRHGPPVPGVLAGSRRRPTAPGAGWTGRPGRHRRPILRQGGPAR